MLKDLSKKKKIKNMNRKMTTKSQLLTTKPKKQKQSKQLGEQQNHRNGGHVKDYHGGRKGEKVQGIRSINGR